MYTPCWAGEASVRWFWHIGCFCYLPRHITVPENPARYPLPSNESDPSARSLCTRTHEHHTTTASFKLGLHTITSKQWCPNLRQQDSYRQCQSIFAQRLGCFQNSQTPGSLWFVSSSYRDSNPCTEEPYTRSRQSTWYKPSQTSITVLTDFTSVFGDANPLNQWAISNFHCTTLYSDNAHAHNYTTDFFLCLKEKWERYQGQKSGNLYPVPNPITSRSHANLASNQYWMSRSSTDSSSNRNIEYILNSNWSFKTSCKLQSLTWSSYAKSERIANKSSLYFQYKAFEPLYLASILFCEALSGILNDN